MWQAIRTFFGAPLGKAGALTAIKVWQAALAVTVVAASAAGTYTYIRLTAPNDVIQHVVVFVGGMNSEMSSCQESTFDDLLFTLVNQTGITGPYAEGCNAANQNYLQSRTSMIFFSYNGGHMDERRGVWLPDNYQGCDANNHRLADDVKSFDDMLTSYQKVFPRATFTIVGHSLGGLIGLQAAYTYSLEYAKQHQHTSIDRVITIDSPLEGIFSTQQMDSMLNFASEHCSNIKSLAGQVLSEDLMPLGKVSLVSSLCDAQQTGTYVAPPIVLSQCAAAGLFNEGVSVVTLGNKQDGLFCTSTWHLFEKTCESQVLLSAPHTFQNWYDLPPLSNTEVGHSVILSTSSAVQDIARYLLAPVVTIQQPLSAAPLNSPSGTSLPFSATVRCLWGPARHASAWVQFEGRQNALFAGTSTPTDTSDTVAIKGFVNVPPSLKNASGKFFIDAGGDACQYLPHTTITPMTSDYLGGEPTGIPFALTSGVQSTQIYGSFSQSSPSNPNNDAKLLAQSSTLTVPAGQPFDLYFDYENTGNTSWTGGQGYQLVCDTKSIPGAICMGGMPQGVNGIGVPPDYQSTFYVTVNAPLKAGTFETAWNMAQKGVTFGQSQVGVKVNVTVPVTVPMPATQTSCPSSGAARAAVVRPLALGNDDNVVYVKTIKSASDTPVSATLYRYDVTTGKTTQILQVDNVDITDPQVSADGRWVIFISEVDGSQAMQMVRMDGQGLQTLYCVPPTQYAYQQVILDILLSPDQKRLAFVSGIDLDQGTFSLLNMTDGTLQRALQPPPQFTIYQPAMWLNDTQLYVQRFPLMQDALFLMDTQNGPDQPASALTNIADFPSLTGFDVSPDRTKLYIGLCQVCGQGIFVGPSTISVQPATGTTQHLIYTAPKGALLSLLVAPDGTTLFFSLESYSEDPSIPADPSVDGVWKVNVDGTGLTHLTSGGINFALNSHQDISNDGKWYLLSSNTALFVSLLNGATPVQLASVSDAASTSLVAVGWTTM